MSTTGLASIIQSIQHDAVAIWLAAPAAVLLLCYFALQQLFAPSGKGSVKPSNRIWRLAQPFLQPADARDDPISPPTFSTACAKSDQVLGDIMPLKDLDFTAVEPLRIYKFSPKYFLTMGLQKTDINWITHIDNTYAQRVRARQEIVAQYPTALDCLDSAVPMLNELYDFLMGKYLPQRYPTVFRLLPASAQLENLVTGEKVPSSAPQDRFEALEIINRTADEDFLMLLPSPDGDGYSLQSFVWAYPVGFDPQSKLGMKLRDAHKPVPGYKDKLATSMDRYFGKLQPGNIMYRVNWAVATNDSLCERGEYHLYDGQDPTETDIDLDNCYVRCELQTLFALPVSGGRILSVHLYLYPLREIKEVGLGPQMVEAIDGLKQGNVPGFHRYKRAVVWGEKVKEYLLS